MDLDCPALTPTGIEVHHKRLTARSLSNTSSAEINGVPKSNALAANRRSNGSRCPHARVGPFKQISGAQCGYSAALFYQQARQMVDEWLHLRHLPIRTFCPISKKLIGLTKTLSASVIGGCFGR
ncbi:hypothetical protein EV128_13914 [Rhizobium azibense]|nr:hypothetical protein EV128_13914 [Rhizobium azibense]